MAHGVIYTHKKCCPRIQSACGFWRTGLKTGSWVPPLFIDSVWIHEDFAFQYNKLFPPLPGGTELHQNWPSLFSGLQILCISELHFADVFCKYLPCLDSREIEPVCCWSGLIKVTLSNSVSEWPRLLLGVLFPRHVVLTVPGIRTKVETSKRDWIAKVLGREGRRHTKETNSPPPSFTALQIY